MEEEDGPRIQVLGVNGGLRSGIGIGKDRKRSNLVTSKEFSLLICVRMGVYGLYGLEFGKYVKFDEK